MTLKQAVYLVVSLFLTAGIALAQQTSPTTPAPSESLREFSLFFAVGGFLGVYCEDINKENLSRYGLREAHGVGVTEVIKDSPAEKAGLKKGDVILRFENEAVSSVRKLNRLVSEVAPDHTVSLAFSRSGAEQNLSVTIGSRQHYAATSMPEFHDLGKLNGWQGFLGDQKDWKWEMPESGKEPFVFAFGNNRRIGVSTTPLTKQLADFFGVADGQGVLVTSVEADGPAAKAGLKAGDVITAVDGEKIDGAGDLSRGINKQKEGDVSLTIVRDKNQRTLKVTPKQRTGTLVQPGTPQAGMRRVVIPQINLPTIPAANISLPRIELPVIPEINVIIPNTPKVKVIKGQRGPI